jgi:phage terminase large subunit-like protein
MARQAVSRYHARRADRIVAETNNGGDLAENTIRQIDTSVSSRQVWAKPRQVHSGRAGQGRMHHVGGSNRSKIRCTLSGGSISPAPLAFH